MNSLRQAFCWQRSIENRVIVILCLVVLFTSYPSSSAAQGAATCNTLKLLGKFAMGVITNLTSAILVDQVHGMIHPEQGKPPEKKGPTDTRNAVPQRPEKKEPQITGYRFTLMWQSNGVNYSGTLEMRGVTGKFRVRTPIDIVDQDMRAQLYNRDILLVGSNPRYAGSIVLRPYYAPDMFRLTQLPNGEWTIADTCDSLGRCAPVHLEEAVTLYQDTSVLME